MPRAGGCHPLLGSVVGVAVEPEFLSMSYGFFVFRRRSQFIYSLHVDKHSKHFSYGIPFSSAKTPYDLTPVLPKSIKAGYINCKLRPYIPNPLRCFKCQWYGHSQQSCRSTDPVCVKCAETGHEINVCTSDTFKCRNCSGPHAASPKSCPAWIFEKEVIAVKMKRNITFPESRQIVKDRTPKVGVSYSSTIQMQTISTTTHLR
ncbi:hypothetical protein AVEN_223513-1 [Araneus ventricosus]|uniref:CCHC-type domain-containing protein n=1 Tax=Araneus ventricosus TaxID=182803 RepID=A0A4Y2DIF0_ARAVE|nr:hypothetical protein AVEN_223513-1 [Araneus ventricosus]